VKPSRSYRAVAVCCVVLFALAPIVGAQDAAAPKPAGVPQDWSQRHIVFSRDALAQHPELIYREPRVLYQAMQRWQAPSSDVFHAVAPVPPSGDISGTDRDWNVALGGRLSPDMYPAKYSFDASAPPDCTNDWVVFGLAVAGVTGGVPNLIAFNNLYVNSAGTGFCTGTAPKVLFAYNTTTAAGGKIVTSPILSEDGTKIAFVESLTTSAIFHVLTWSAGQGALKVSVAPTSMTSITFSATAGSTTSSPWVDYASDTVYLGADNGLVYKITGVFKGTPTLAGAPWPVTVSTNLHLTPPVLDSSRGLLMVGSMNGSLYQINVSTGALKSLAVGKSGATSPGVIGAPIIDVGSGTTFVVSANGASSAPGGFSAVLVEVDTALMTSLSKAVIGEGSATKTALTLREPAFDNNYYNNPSTGLIRLCGTGAADTTPWQYAFGFTETSGQFILDTTPSFSQQLLTSTAARCTGWTEFYNPNISGGTDFFFFGLTQDCTATGVAGGCVEALNGGTNTLTTATVNGGPSGVIVDNFSTDAGASSIYFMADRVDTAYKFTQNGLQ
jgi:hypothetical protein